MARSVIVDPLERFRFNVNLIVRKTKQEKPNTLPTEELAPELVPVRLGYYSITGLYKQVQPNQYINEFNYKYLKLSRGLLKNDTSFEKLLELSSSIDVFVEILDKNGNVEKILSFYNCVPVDLIYDDLGAEMDSKMLETLVLRYNTNL